MNQGAEKLMKPESNNESNNHESDRGGENGRLMQDQLQIINNIFH